MQSPRVAIAGICAAVLWICWFGAGWHLGFDLADEGYYWYGAQRVVAGEVPLRDFHSYDVGRYFVSAAVMQATGDVGLLPARVASALFGFLTAWIGSALCLLACPDNTRQRTLWLAAPILAGVFAVWTSPLYKSFDHAASVAIVGSALLLAAPGSPRRWFLAGFGVGLAAVVGRNHGLYGTVALVLVLAILARTAGTEVARRARVAAAGCVLGYAPTAIVVLAYPGFGQALIDSVLWLFQHRTTNIGLPVPWPWTNAAEAQGRLLEASRMAVGVGFLMLIGWPVAVVVAMLVCRPALDTVRWRVLMASTVCAIPYAHYGFSRADLTHLALAIPPLLVGLGALACSLARGRYVVGFCACLLAASMLTMLRLQPVLGVIVLPSSLTTASVDGHRLRMVPRDAYRLEQAQAVLGRAEAGGSPPSFFAAPNLLGLYAVYRVRSPLWDIYPLMPQDPARAALDIQQLELAAPRYVLLDNAPLDGVPHMSYERLRPAHWTWTRRHYDMVSFQAASGVQVHVRKAP